MHWRFYEIELSDLSGVLTGGLREIRPEKRQLKVREKLRARLLAMETLNQSQWPPTWTTSLTGFDKILELRFEVWNIQYRPLFFFAANQQIVFAFFALEIGDQFVPSDAPSRAQSARTELLAGRGKVNEIDILSLV